MIKTFPPCCLRRMESVKAAVDALRKAANKERVEKAIESQIEHISTFFVLLVSAFKCPERARASPILFSQDTSVPSQKSISKLTKILRVPFIPLYNVFPVPALHLTATVFELLSKKSIIPSTARDEDALEGWEEVQKSIVSGIMVRKMSDPSAVRVLKGAIGLSRSNNES
jgi:hypothetical protein